VSYPGLSVPFVDEDGNEDMPTLTTLGRAFASGTITFSTDGSLAFATLNGETRVWRVNGTLDQATWEPLDVALDGPSRQPGCWVPVSATPPSTVGQPRLAAAPAAR
jgi:hypothetical protein